MKAVIKIDLIDLYFPTEATVEALLMVPADQREVLARSMLTGMSEPNKDPHIARVLTRIEELAGRGRS